jgi:hypothetical protein
MQAQSRSPHSRCLEAQTAQVHNVCLMMVAAVVGMASVERHKACWTCHSEYMDTTELPYM